MTKIERATVGKNSARRCFTQRLLLLRSLSVICFVGLQSLAATAADRIVLRNLDIITDRTVAGFDEDGVRLDDGSLLKWDEIERCKLSPDKQAAFDQMLQELGTHLYRIRQRLTVGDYRGILTHAEAIYPRYAGRNSETAYMVFQGLMWARLAVGRREAAVEPYLRCYNYLKSLPASQLSLPGNRRLRFDRATGMTPELQPVWFDAQAAKSSLPGALKAVSEMSPPRPEGTRIYYGTLALAAGELEQAQRVLGGIQGKHPGLAQLRGIVMAQGEVLGGQPGQALSLLQSNLQRLAPNIKPLAIYWLGMSKLKAPDERVQRQGILDLLHLPALYGDKFPELAAAALYESRVAFAGAKDDNSRAAVRRELLEQYSQTYHAAKLRAELSPKSDSS